MNIEVGIRYVESWLRGNGAAAIHNLMEDAATAEISRSQVWQQIKNGTRYDDTGNTATRELVAEVLDQQKEVLRSEVDAEAFEKHFEPAAALVRDLVLGEDYVDFLTLPAYGLLEGRG